MPFQIDEEKLADAKVLDRANPPIKSVPFQQFPQMVYNHTASKAGTILTRTNPISGAEIETHVPEKIVHKVVQDKRELDAALKAGWELKPPKFEAPSEDPV